MSQKKKKIQKLLIGPVVTIILLTIVIMVVSAVLSTLGFEGQKAAIVNGTLETSLVTVKNIFTIDGLKYIFGNAITNFKIFEPLVVLIICLIGIGIADASGLIKAITSFFKNTKTNILLFITIFIGIISTFIGEYAFLILLPLAPIVYKYLGHNPIVGIITVFLGITIGYGTGIIYNYDTFLLGNLTEIAAQVDVDKNYQFDLMSNIYIMIISTILLSVIGTILIERVIIPKLGKSKDLEEESKIISKRALYYSNFAFIFMLFLVIYAIVPGFYSSGILLDSAQETYVAKLLGDASPFKEGMFYIFIIIVMVCSWIYGKVSGNITDTNQYSIGLAKIFQGLGYVFVLLFFFAQMIGILHWTNLGEVTATRLIDFMSTLQFSGAPLIITLFIVVILIGLLVPYTLTKWILMSPIIVPLFMRSNITPDFTQFIFVVADGIGKGLTPLFVYFIIMLAFLQKYNSDESFKITVFGTLRLIMPFILMMIGVWLLIILGWYIIGLPTGVGIYPTL